MRDLTDSTINNWYIRDRAGKDNHGNATWNCKCLICGKWYIKPAYVITSGHSKSCGCTRKSEDLTGKIVKGRKAIKFYNGKWECECIECGKKSFIQTTYFTRGDFGDCSCKREKYNNRFEIDRKEDYFEDIEQQNVRVQFIRNSDDLRDKNYHQRKSIACISNGIRLINIYEYEWLRPIKRKILTDIVNRALNKSEVNKVYARKTEVKYVETEKIRGFLNENHLQGYTASSVNLGLYSDGELVEVMTFGKPRFNTECEWELIRLCTKLGYSVVGGSEKLFKAFLRKYSPKKIISYCNIGKFNGSVYFMLGFRFNRITSPNYVWVNLKSGEILTRYQTMKREIIKRFNLSENCMDTEDDIMKFYGFVKIYDSGNAVLSWNREI